MKKKLYKLHIGLPAMTKYEWLIYSGKLYQNLYLLKLENKNYKNSNRYKEGANFLLKIYKKFKIKTL